VADPGTTLNPNIIDILSRNIAGIESAGWKNPYEALNPTTHAIGKYQVMPSNVAGWTQAALGQSMTPDEFRANPSAQEAVFRDQMQRNLHCAKGVTGVSSAQPNHPAPATTAINKSQKILRMLSIKSR
jgi:hypothetical protein